MDRHLVSVEIRVEGRTDQRMELDRLSLYQDRLKGLYAQTMERRGAVQHDGVLLDHTLQDIPDHRVQSLHHLLRILDIVRLLGLDELLHDEGLEELDRHLLRHAALIDL